MSKEHSTYVAMTIELLGAYVLEQLRGEFDPPDGTRFSVGQADEGDPDWELPVFVSVRLPNNEGEVKGLADFAVGGITEVAASLIKQVAAGLPARYRRPTELNTVVSGNAHTVCVERHHYLPVVIVNAHSLHRDPMFRA